MALELLFQQHDVYDLVESQKKFASNRIAAAPLEQAEIADERIVANFVAEYELTVPVLDETAIYVTEREIEIDISRYPMRMIVDRSRLFYVKGTEITVHVPYTGEKVFFGVKPTTFTLSPPRAQVVNQKFASLHVPERLDAT